MIATAALESPSSATGSEVRARPARPDVAVILGADDGHQAMEVAVRKAAASGGHVCVIRYVDNIGIRSPDPLIRRSEVARSHLARIVAEHLSLHPDARVTARLHVGTLDSLLRTLEPSIGSVVLDGARGPSIFRTVSLSPVPLVVVDAVGSTTTYLPAPEEADDRG